MGVDVGAAVVAAAVSMPAQQMVTETRDPAQRQTGTCEISQGWTTQPFYPSPLVDHLPRVPGIPMPKDIWATTSALRQANLLRRHREYYRALLRRAEPRQDRNDRQVG